jgi:hypothetical protein
VKSASFLLWHARGSPRNPECIDLPSGSRCWVCGSDITRGMPHADWTGAENVPQYGARCDHSPYVCEACLATAARFSPMPPRPPATATKTKTRKDGSTEEVESQAPRWGNFSVLYDDGTVVTASKGEKPVILKWLRTPRRGEWFACIHESGQKMQLPWCPVNPPGSQRGRIRFETADLTVPAHDDPAWSIADDTRELLTAGASKEELLSGDYSVGSWQRCGSQIEAFELAHGALRGSAWFALVTWLVQRDEDAVTARIEAEKAARAAKKQESKRVEKEKRNPTGDKHAAKRDDTKASRSTRRKAASGHRGPDSERDPRDASGVSSHVASERDGALEPAALTDADCSTNERLDRRVVHADQNGTATERTERKQLTLF